MDSCHPSRRCSCTRCCVAVRAIRAASGSSHRSTRWKAPRSWPCRRPFHIAGRIGVIPRLVHAQCRGFGRMRVGHIERAGFDRARHRTACFRTAGERHVACRIAIYGFLGYRIRVRIVVQVLLGKTFERPRLRVAAVGSHGLHHQLFGHVFRFVGAAALRLFAGSPNMEGQRLRPFAIVVILIVPRFVHRDACRFRLPNVQYRESAPSMYGRLITETRYSLPVSSWVSSSSTV